MRLTIGLKIFGVASVLLVLMAGVALVSTSRIQEASQEIDAVAHYYVPLSSRIGKIQTQVLEQEILVHLILHDFDTSGSHGQSIEAHMTEFEELGQQVDQEVEKSLSLIKQAMSTAVDEEARLELSRVGLLLNAAESQHQSLHDLVVRTVKAYQAGKSEAVETLIVSFNLAQKSLDESTEGLVRFVLRVSKRVAEHVEKHAETVLRFNIIITAIALTLGLTLAAFLTRGVVRPVRVLREGTRAVEEGNLSQEIPITTRDEIADLTRAFNHMVDGLRTKERVQTMFGKYVDPRVVEAMLSGPEGHDAAAGAGEKKLVTVFFSDVAGFTAMGEQLSPIGLIRLFNEYFSLASAPIAQNRGVIDKYIGDAIMAFWCAPFVTEDEQASLACLAALAQFDQLETLRERMEDITGLRKGVPDIAIRVGIASGNAVVGSIGSEYARNYTVIGDTVNLGSRLESVNKAYGTKILICEHTRALLDEQFETREIDSIAVAGKSEAVRIFELLCVADELNRETAVARDAFEAGLSAYRTGDWQSAESGFRSCLDCLPDDRPAQVFLQRLVQIRTAPPETDWDGVWRFATK